MVLFLIVINVWLLAALVAQLVPSILGSNFAMYTHPVSRVYFLLHPARYEPVSAYLEPHSRRTHVPLVRHPPSLDIKANRKVPAIRRHCLAWEHQA